MTRQYATKVPRDRATEALRRETATKHLEAGLTTEQANAKVKEQHGMGVRMAWLRKKRAALRKAEGLAKFAERKALAVELLKKGVKHADIHRKVKNKYGAGFDMTKLAALREELGLPSGGNRGVTHAKSRVKASKKPNYRRKKHDLAALESLIRAGATWGDAAKQFRAAGGKVSNVRACALAKRTRAEGVVTAAPQRLGLPPKAPVFAVDGVDEFIGVLTVLKDFSPSELAMVSKALAYLQGG